MSACAILYLQNVQSPVYKYLVNNKVFESKVHAEIKVYLKKCSFLEGFIKVGGYSGLEEKYMKAIPGEINVGDLSNESACGIPREDSFHIFRHPTESDLPWPGMLSGIFLLGSWYWCTDQVKSLSTINIGFYISLFEQCFYHLSATCASMSCAVYRII